MLASVIWCQTKKKKEISFFKSQYWICFGSKLIETLRGEMKAEKEKKVWDELNTQYIVEGKVSNIDSDINSGQSLTTVE